MLSLNWESHLWNFCKFSTDRIYFCSRLVAVNTLFLIAYKKYCISSAFLTLGEIFTAVFLSRDPVSLWEWQKEKKKLLNIYLSALLKNLFFLSKMRFRCFHQFLLFVLCNISVNIWQEVNLSLKTFNSHLTFNTRRVLCCYMLWKMV